MSDTGPEKKIGRPSNADIAARNAAAPNAQRPPEHLAAPTSERPAPHAPAHDRPRVRTRQSHATIAESVFDIPKEEIPEGSSYEWKRYTVGGQEDPFYLNGMRRQGWEPVDPRRHPNWVPPDYREPFIIRGGQILMERPMELTKQARDEQKMLAKQQMREAEQRLGMTPKDTLTRDHAGLHKYGQPVVKEWGRSIPVEE